MPREYDEKRDFIRVDVDCEVKFTAADSPQEEIGRVANLSGRGMMIIAGRELKKNSLMEVKINPSNDLTPPLHANVKIVRVAKQRRGDGYEIGAVIQEVIDDE